MEKNVRENMAYNPRFFQLRRPQLERMLEIACGTEAASPGGVVFYGDSLTQLFPVERLFSELPGIQQQRQLMAREAEKARKRTRSVYKKAFRRVSPLMDEAGRRALALQAELQNAGDAAEREQLLRLKKELDALDALLALVALVAVAAFPLMLMPHVPLAPPPVFVGA